MTLATITITVTMIAFAGAMIYGALEITKSPKTPSN